MPVVPRRKDDRAFTPAQWGLLRDTILEAAIKAKRGEVPKPDDLRLLGEAAETMVAMLRPVLD